MPDRPRRPLRARRRWHWPTVTRDTVLVGAGLAGFFHEVFFRGAELSERVYVLATCVALMGLAPILRFDERRRRKADDDDDG